MPKAIKALYHCCQEVEADTLRTLLNSLPERVIRLRQAETQDQVRTMLSKEKLDAFLLDCREDFEGGLDLLRELRKESLFTPAVLFIPESDPESLNKCLQISATKVLPAEGLNGENLVRAIDNVVDNQSKLDKLHVLSSVAQQASSAQLLADPSGFVSWINPSFTQMTGFELKDLLNRNYRNLLFGSESAAHSVSVLRHAEQLEKAATVELVCYRRDKSTFWCKLDLTPILDPAGKLSHFLLAGQDISERIQFETLLAQREARYRLLAENATDAICRHEPDGTFRYVSPASNFVFGHPPENLRGETLYDFIHPDDLASIRQAHDALIKEGKSFNCLYRFRKANGKWSWVETNAKYVSDATNYNEAGLITVTRNADERMRFELELKEAKVAADRANETKSAFLANMSHEIRNPMHAILGYAELLKEQLPPKLSDLYEYAEIITHSTEHLLSLINDILDLSKIEAGKLVLEEIEFNMHELAEATCTLMRNNANEKGLELEYSWEENLPRQVVGDESRLRQVLLNLISNAIKFTAEGKVQVHICDPGDNKEANTQAYLIEVTDTGIGIPPDRQSAIFEAFTQADQSTNRKFGGTGLGLTISRQIVEKMKGSISLDPTYTAGARFRIHLSLMSVEGEVRKQEQDTGSSQFPDLSHLSVAIIDDDKVNRHLFSNMLSVFGCQPTLCPNASSFLACVMDSRYDVVFSDITMPGIDGVQLMKMLRNEREAHIRNIWIVATTAHTMQGDREAFLAAGFNDYIGKPVRLEDLQRALELYGASKDETKAED